MTDLGDMCRLFDKLEIEYSITDGWYMHDYIKIFDVPDPAGPVNGRLYGTEYIFDGHECTYRSMSMYYQDVE